MKMKMSKMISINWSDFWATNSPPFGPLPPPFLSNLNVLLRLRKAIRLPCVFIMQISNQFNGFVFCYLLSRRLYRISRISFSYSNSTAIEGCPTKSSLAEIELPFQSNRQCEYAIYTNYIV